MDKPEEALLQGKFQKHIKMIFRLAEAAGNQASIPKLNVVLKGRGQQDRGRMESSWQTSVCQNSGSLLAEREGRNSRPVEFRGNVIRNSELNGSPTGTKQHQELKQHRPLRKAYFDDCYAQVQKKSCYLYFH